MKFLFTCLLIILLTVTNYSQIDSKYFQDNWEVYLQFNVDDFSILKELSDKISIDNIEEKTVYAYMNESEYNDFLKYGISYKQLPHPGDVEAAMSSSLRDLREWDSYPTYEAYVQMMYQFAADHPSLCEIVDAGNTVQGRKILFAKISDNVSVKEDEPQFMYSSTMHGDETTGYVLMLRLIDSLLTGYGVNNKITNLVNNVEIWINPNANPDGTYRTGNHTVTGARRYNANSYDLNRNFPDPAAGPNPNGPWQPETIVMMNLASANNFILSANFHGGAEVVNYPWDTWARLTPDDTWFQFISHLYADTAQANSPSGYMSGFNDGITNGYAWYRVTGGRQDYFTYFKRGRELTVELSNTKLLSASLLPAHWNYNKQSMLNYIETCLYGIKGKVNDPDGNPVKAFVKVEGHDFDNSEVYSDSLTGMYFRMIKPGNFSVTFSADSFHSKTVSNISVTNFTATELNVILDPLNPIPVELISFTASVIENKVQLNWKTASETNNSGFAIERQVLSSEYKVLRPDSWEKIDFIEGNGTTTMPQEYSFIDEDVLNGKYKYRLKQIDYNGSFEYSNEIEADVNTLPGEFALYQNYPNPFNPVTKIKYAVAGVVTRHSASGGPSLRVELKIYDILGNQIATLVNEEKSPGEYEVEWNAENFSSGIYFYTLSVTGGASEFSAAKKLILMK